MIIKADRQTYLRDHLVMAAIGAGGATLALVYLQTGDVWVGMVGALAAIGLRGWYMASEELNVIWEISDGALRAPSRVLPLSKIAEVRTILSAVQVIAQDGNKYLIKYQADPKSTAAEIRAMLPHA
ncbi:hypothetical protein [Primorskyibacter sp. S187A]|uniref:hypothetical protein n=1 Tax=Primorskyibacter sp. S187A TaxID=3415130 RepID=UPI003C7DD326